MYKERPKILTIAGFDPSGGAGILADIKTFEAHKCLGFAVITANTIQSESEFIAPNWINEDEVLNQLRFILKQHRFEYVKIGLIPSLEFLTRLNSELINHYPSLKIIWDPILSASTGFDFKHDLSALKEMLKDIYLITPNWEEIKQLSGNEDAKMGAEELSQFTSVYLKGGHNEKDPGKDYLFFEGKVYPLNPKNKKPIYPKHGSGCVFSSALTANLASGFPILKAALRSKRYVEKYLSSSSTLLGYHKL
ncbi:MAG: hydroxymethylpyrimidine/phosphomethylpyrimidine kinase [Flavobacteriales bacterium]